MAEYRKGTDAHDFQHATAYAAGRACAHDDESVLRVAYQRLGERRDRRRLPECEDGGLHPAATATGYHDPARHMAADRKPNQAERQCNCQITAGVCRV